MRILLMYRLMSGLQSVANDRQWRPAGAPTAVKLIEALDKSGDELDLVLYPADPGENLVNYGSIDVDGLSSKVTVLDYGLIFKKMPPRLRLFLAPFWRAVWSLRRVARTAPHLYYTDRGNVLAASTIARMTSVKTVLRVLGVPPSMWTIFDGNRPTQILNRYSFRAPFSLVVGTKDGSGIAQFFRKSLGPRVPWLTRVNGVDKSKPSQARKSKILKLVFLGRLEPLKGAEELLDAIFELPASVKDSIHLTYIGHGSLEEQMRSVVKKRHLTKQISFTGMIEHKDVQKHLAKGDIYISLNEQGQISNANLEAAAAGLGMILSTTIEENDREAKEILGENTIIWIEREGLEANLQNAIIELVNNPNAVQTKKRAAKKNLSFLNDWDERVNWEIELLRSLASNSFDSADWQANQNDRH